MVAAYLLHSGFKPTAQRALSYFGDARTANAQGVTIPSQMRWVHYYEHILKHGPAPTQMFRITHIRTVTVPNLEIVSVAENCTGARVCDYFSPPCFALPCRKAAVHPILLCTLMIKKCLTGEDTWQRCGVVATTRV
jgi:hypothetical protein